MQTDFISQYALEKTLFVIDFFKYRGDRIIVLKNWRRSHHFIAFRASHHFKFRASYEK